MKRYFALVLALLFATLIGARAQGMDEQYVQIFNLIQEGDNLSSTQPGKALAKYAEAQAALQRIQKGSPDWNSKIVSFRLAYIATKISALSTTGAGEPAVAAPAGTNAIPGAGTTNAPTPAAAQPAAGTAEIESQVRALREQVRQLQAERIVMEAKLKEALAMQPAEADPRELARAEEKLKALQKENDLLRVSIETEKSKPVPAPDTKAVEQAQPASLAEANRQLAQQKDLVFKLTVERDALQARAKSVSTGSDVAALQAENQLLKQRLAGGAPVSSRTGDSVKLTQTQAEIAALQSDKELLRIEKVALENRLKQLTTNTVGSSVLEQSASTPDAVRVRQLERDRDDLQKKLEAANKATYGRKGSAVASRVQQLEFELATARARLEVFEARQVPYSAEELALLKTPETKFAEAPPKSTRRPSRDLPSGSARLVAEARTYFASREFDKAEAAYTQVVHMDQKNVPALANLAAIQIEAGHLEEAEKNIKSALAEDPEDAFSLYIFGILKFRQTKYDDALSALSRAAKLDPENPEIQNYLGLALSEKGMRGPAETALRKAIQIQPNYAGAHYNLAIVYLAQQPPAVELARWHYQKAISAGHAKSSDLEQKLGSK